MAGLQAITWTNDDPVPWHYMVSSTTNRGKLKKTYMYMLYRTFDDSVQVCSNSIANALELLQSCAKSSICNL